MQGSIDINNIPTYLAIITGCGVTAVVVTEAVKKLFGMESSKYVHFMSMGVSAVMTLASYILEYKNMPVSVLGVNGAAIHGISQAVYKTSKVLLDLLAKVADSLHGPSRVATAIDSSTAGVDAAVAAFTAPSETPAEPAAPASNELNF
jgi:hypothetical protein